MGINKNSDHIRISGHKGTWYVISECEARLFKNSMIESYYLLEHETWGDEVPALIVDKSAKVIVMDEVYNGFLDLQEAFEDAIIYTIDGTIIRFKEEPIYYEDIPKAIDLSRMARIQDVKEAFRILQEAAKVLGCPIVMDPDCSNPVSLKIKENSAGKAFLCVDKDYSYAIMSCPRCGGDLRPSDVPGYENVCPACDENFN